MSSRDIAVSVRGLAKSYTISHNTQQFTTIREALIHRVKKPLERTEKETFWALKSLNFDIMKGAVVGIIGRNGAGKSTLLKVLSQITEPTNGEIKLYGRIGSLLEVGTGFHPELTGRENIFLNGAILGMARNEITAQFDAIVEFAGVEKFLDTPVKRYSSGMYVRLAFAVAAHLRSEILIIDEVLAVGDAEFQRKCLGKMKDISTDGRTVIFVSHSMGAIRNLCDKVVVLNKGEVIFDGDCSTGISIYSENTSGDNFPILGHLKRVHQDLEISQVVVNEKISDYIEVPTGQDEILITIAGIIKKKLSMDIEVWLTDISDMPLAFHSAGHLSGFTPEWQPGPFSLTRRLRLPSTINRGEYLLSLSLTHHNVCGWADLPQCVRLNVEGAPTATGNALSYQDGKGFMVLEEV